MNMEKVPRIRVMFCGLIAFTGIINLVLLAYMNNFLPDISTTNVKKPLPMRRNDVQDTQSNPRQVPDVLVKNRVCKILLFNSPWEHFVNNTRKCEFSNCWITRNRSDIQNYSAILFYIDYTWASLPVQPPISPSNRNPNQVWIFVWRESPVRQRILWRTYLNEHWRNTANWTMSYTYDADVFNGYGTIRKRIPPVKNYSEIFNRKTKMAAWIVSHCTTMGQREEYVQKLQQYGVKVDIFGKCTGQKIENHEVKLQIEMNYKFYLSFENTLCKDYITEKFFRYLQYDVVLVVRGGGNYSSLLPNDSYINTADFGHIKDLAKYLLTIGSSEKSYSKYLENKDRFYSVPVRASFCHICEKLNHLEENRRTVDFFKEVHNNTCFSPTDIN